MDHCPPFNVFFRPLLSLATAGEINVRESAKRIADQFGMTDQAKLEATKGGNHRRYIDRTHWAATYLRQAGLLVTTKRGFVKITDQGSDFLRNHEGQINVKNLRSIPAFADFQARQGTRRKTVIIDHTDTSDTLTPHDRISEALDDIEEELATTLLDSFQNSSPSFFEKAVVDLLLCMGYGANRTEAGYVIGKSGDDGVDGLINQDALGLERVYIQAKRYQSDNKISAEAIRGFTGALNVQQASKGLFVSTSAFTDSAISTAERVPQRIVLIDGKRFSRLMIRYGVGCLTHKTLSIKKFDTDYFE